MISVPPSVWLSTVSQAGSPNRTFHLLAGESISLKAQGTLSYVVTLRGHCRVERDGKALELDPQASVRSPYTLQPDGKVHDIHAHEEVFLCHLGPEAFDLFVNLTQLGGEFGRHADSASTRSFMRLQGSVAFRRLPVEVVHEIVGKMTPRNVVAGETVVRQGEPGETFFLIDEGKAEVWQQGLYDEEPQCVSTLRGGDTFGEEAVITGGTRSATVRMVADGKLLTLDKETYHALISRSMVKKVDPELAKSLIDRGYKILDVRYVEEYDESHIGGAELIPLHELRDRLGELDSAERYVVYCRSGKRSSVAALLMSQRNIEAVSMDGGINDWPFGVVEG